MEEKESRDSASSPRSRWCEGEVEAESDAGVESGFSQGGEGVETVVMGI